MTYWNTMAKFGFMETLNNEFGDPKPAVEFTSAAIDPYHFTVSRDFADVQRGDSAWAVDHEKGTVSSIRGPAEVHADVITVIRGYAPANRSASFQQGVNLPYINGCMAETLIGPQRPGDPTAQLLRIPAYASEQKHHIHSTARVVIVIAGKGLSIIGMPSHTEEVGLSPGTVLILGRGLPHHFETQDLPLTVLPIHIWSSTPAEFSHPMKIGTVEV